MKESTEGYQYYTIDGLVVADAFIRLESFRADFALIAKQLGVAVPQELPRRKADYRLDNRPAREILSGEQKRTVFEKCREEFELFGYEC